LRKVFALEADVDRFTVAIPVAFGLDEFLGGLEYYRVTISPLDILLGLAIMFVLGVGTMASQTLKAATTNPAETLKHE
jgi:putative ABC transport system permease protein